MNIFSFIKSRILIQDVVSEYTSLKKAGLYWKASCPFHSEKDASFTVSPHKEIFYCFGCHAGGDVISFIEKMEQCSPLEAARFLVDRYNIEVPEDIEWDRSGATSFEEKEHYFKLCSSVADWAHQALLKSREALKYLVDRGITKNSITTYNLGYFPGTQKGISSLLKFVQKQNILADDLVEVHILTEGKGYLYSPFEERIIFPIKDHLGRFCGFGGRIFKKHDERAKYYNSRENSYFQKGKLIFGLDHARSYIQKTNEVFLVEGYTDCIAMNQKGYQNTISTLGTACTADHLQILSRYCDSLFILYDGDAAGRKAILRLAELCWQVSLELRVVLLPIGQEPASFLAQDGDLKELVNKSRDIFEFFTEVLGKDYQGKTLAEKVESVRKILAMIASISDSLKQTVLLQKAASVLDLPYETLHQELGKIRFKSRGSTSVPAKQDVESKDPLPVKELSKLEKKIFFAIISNIQLFNSKNEAYLVGYFSEPLQSILNRLQKAKIDDPEMDFKQFFDTLEKGEQRLVSGILLECEDQVEGKSFEYLVDQFRRKNWKNMVSTIKTQMKSCQDQAGSSDKLLNDFLSLKKKIFNKEN